ncbi:MAG: tyrosine-type recombinase/integrase [Pseudomonadota bacterium]
METRPLTRHEIKMVLAAADKPRDKALLVLGFNSGYRISELLSLHVADVFTQKKSGWQVRDVITVGKDKMKGKRRARSIRLNSSAKHALMDYAKTLVMVGELPLFGGVKGRGRKAITRQTAWNILKSLSLKALGTTDGIGTHSMRKSFATHMYLATRDVYRVKAYLGHSFIETTELYIKDGLAMLDNNIEDLCLTG